MAFMPIVTAYEERLDELKRGLMDKKGHDQSVRPTIES